MASSQVARWRDKAVRAVEGGNNDEAAQCFRALERLDADPIWARRSAEAYRRLGNTPEEIHALFRAAIGYGRAGDLLRSATLYKQILRVDSTQTDAVRGLRELRRLMGHQSPPENSPQQAPILRAQSWVHRQGDALAGLRLKEVFQGAPQRARASSNSGFHRIPLEDEIADEEPLELASSQTSGGQEQAPPPHATPRRPSFAGENRGGYPSPEPQKGRFEPPRKAQPPRGWSAVDTEDRTEDELMDLVAQEVRTAERADAALTRSSLFQDLGETALGELLVAAKLITLDKDDYVFRQGEIGHALFVVAEGQVGVVDEGPPRKGLAKLGPGDFFGEIALLTDEPRTASVVALTKTQLISIDRTIVHSLITTHAEFLPVLLRFLRDRLVDRVLATNPLFTVLSARDRQALRRRFRFIEADAGATLVRQGTRPSRLLIVLAGEAEVLRDAGDQSVRVGWLKTGDLCGEFALLANEEAGGTVRAAKKCFLLELHRDLFLKIVNSRPDAMAFVRKLIDERRARAKAILEGQGPAPSGPIPLW